MCFSFYFRNFFEQVFNITEELSFSSAFIFTGGMLSGAVLTLLCSKFIGLKKVKFKHTGNAIEYDYIPNTNCGINKLVLVVRNDLKMGKGKIAAQCSHAAVLAHELSRENYPDIFADWKRNGQPKIIVKIDNEREMLELAKRAFKYQVLASIVKDAGKTQVPSGCRTILAVGPGPDNLIDEVTGHLKLY